MTNIQAQPDRQMLLQWLIRTNTQWVWERIAELKERESVESIEAKYFPVMTQEEYSERIDKSREQYRQGNYITLEELEEQMKSW